MRVKNGRFLQLFATDEEKKIRRQARLRRRVGRRVLPVREGELIPLKKKWRISANSLF